jgi:YacP-like NYN domain
MALDDVADGDAAAGGPVEGDAADIPDRVVASALEFAVGIAAAGAKLRPALPFPAELKPYLKFTKLPAKALREVRRAIEGDLPFMRRLGLVAVPELVDEAGILWLTRPDDWQAQLTEVVAAQAGGPAVDDRAALRRSQRQREAAEQVTRRTLAEVVSVRVELERVNQLNTELAGEVVELRRERDALRGEAKTHQAELRRAIDRLSTAHARLESQRATAAAAEQRATEAETMRDAVLADRAASPGEAATDTGADGNTPSVLVGASRVAAELVQQANQARALAAELGRLAGRLESLEPAAPVKPVPTKSADRGRARRTTGRKPVALPGGVYGSSAAAAEFLVRHPGVVVLVDGYNVAKLGWPQLDLEAQRQRCIDTCEDVARRFGANIAVVFDGASVAGASAKGRRLVRVAFSPEGVIADDVLRAEVDAISVETAVLVVTNDQAVLSDVRSMGANTLSSEQWLGLGRR